MQVYIIGARLGYQRMFEEAGWTLSNTMDAADLIQFTGGEDVTPSLYNEGQHPATGNNYARDKREIILFKLATRSGAPIAGICRGGQFTNVMCGGKMYQDIDGHAIYGTHLVRDLIDGDTFQATSTHHQMMRPGASAQVLGIANESTYREKCALPTSSKITRYVDSNEPDYEVLFYKDMRTLCFQPHPEHEGHTALAARYFKYINDYLFTEEESSTS
jgi:carbamoylphosphate synthase small subunit